jgi:hypothetical protein
VKGVYEGGRRTRVEDSTFFRRGKSEIPESRIEIEESRRESELRREVTDALREARECEVVILVDCVCSVALRWDWGCEGCFCCVVALAAMSLLWSTRFWC